MPGRRNRTEHRDKEAKKLAAVKVPYKQKVAIPGQQTPPAKQKIDLPMIVDAMRKDYEAKRDPATVRPGGEKLDDALFKMLEMLLGAANNKPKRGGKLGVTVNQDLLTEQARPMFDTLAGGLKEAFLAKWIPQLMEAIATPPAQQDDSVVSSTAGEADAASPAAKTGFDAIDAAGLAALLLHRNK